MMIQTFRKDDRFVNLTKQTLSESLKTLMRLTPYDKITINNVSSHAGVSRNTFYYHFSDMNELLEWTYDHEIVMDLEAFNQLDRWQDGLMKVLEYTEINKLFCLNTFQSLSRERLELFLFNITYDMLINIIDKHPHSYNLSPLLKHDLADFYGRAIVAQVIHWLNTRLEEPKQEVINRIDQVTHGVIHMIISQQ